MMAVCGGAMRRERDGRVRGWEGGRKAGKEEGKEGGRRVMKEN